MSNRPTIAYQPALDGVRAFAVAVVLLFHAGVPGFRGGYLGVSIFFTLSGYLITSLLLAEHRESGGIDLSRFYARRLRRLLPASFACLVGVVFLAAVTELFDGVTNLRVQIVGAVLQVANWVFLFGEGSYQDLLARSSGTSSPVEHFWSLAIEEQFYWIWPPFMLYVLSRIPRHRGRLIVIGAVTVLASISAPIIASVWGPDAAYWATPARIGEILIGAFLALVLTRRTVPTAAGPLAPVALAVLAACIVAFPSSGGPAYAGALPLVAVVSATLIVGLQAPGRLRRVFEHRAVVWVGTISYGLYLFHWPVFLVVHPDRVGWPEPTVFVVRLAVTLAITVVSYELIEQPIRTARGLRPQLTFTAAGAATALVVAMAVASVPVGLGEYWNPDDDVVEAAAIEVVDTPLAGLTAAPLPGAVLAPPTAAAMTPPTSAPPTAEVPVASPAPAATSATSATEPPVVPSTAPPSTAAVIADPTALPALTRPVRIVVTGDSTAKALGTGLVQWAAANPDIAQVEVVSAPGCGFLIGGERRTGDTIAPIEGCDGWTDEFLLPAVERSAPDVVVAMVSSWDIIDRRWDTEQLLTPLDAPFANRLVADYEGLVHAVFDHGATRVAFVRHPIPDVYWLPAVDAQEDPARHDVLYGVYDRLALGSDRVDVVALDRWFDETGLGRSEDARPDGIHLTPEAAASISEDFLGGAIVRVALGMHES